MAQAYSIAVQFIQIGTNCLPEETHQSFDLGPWPAPVLCRKGIDAQHFDIFIGGTFDYSP
jgi:hypothetical protein